MKPNEGQMFWRSKGAEPVYYTAASVYAFISSFCKHFSIENCRLAKFGINLNAPEECISKIADIWIRDLNSIQVEKSDEQSIPSISLGIAFIIEENCLIRVTLGGDTDRNSVFIEKRKELGTQIFLEYFKYCIAYFKPVWGTISPFEFWHKIADQKQNEYRIGWVNYFSNEIVLPEVFTQGLRFKKIETGTIYFITEEEFDYTNEEHVRIGMEKVEVLRKHNIVDNV